MSVDLTNPIFHNEDAAREHFEAQRWPNGPVCPHCGEKKRLSTMKGKSHRKGLHQCNNKDCLQAFSVTVGTVMERTRIPLVKWALGFHLMAASKKGISSHQLHRNLGITYKSAWFMSMRIREAMGICPENDEPIGGKNKVVESDETYVGGKARNVHKSKPIPKKHAVVTLVERDGQVRAKHVPHITGRTVSEHLDLNVSAESALMTDESMVYVKAGRKFADHLTVNHSANEYIRLGGFVHVNTAESFHAIVKRSIMGSWHAISEQHLERYVNEIAFRWNNRSALGIDDTTRANNAIKGAEGKRLMYQQSRDASQAG